MKNPIKQYFLFLSRGPFLFSLIISIIGIVAAFIYNGVNEKTTVIFNNYGWLFFIIVFINMCLAYLIRSKFITTDNSSEAPIRLFNVLVTKEGEKILITKPIWKKGIKYIITRKNFYLFINSDKLKGETETNFCIQGKYKNSLVKVPALLTLKCDGEIDKINLFDVLIKNCPPWEKCGGAKNQKELLLDDYLEIAIKKANEPNQAKFDEIISRYAQLTISDSEFLSELLDAIEFPERIFPCVTDTKICLGNPKTSACKGMMCEK